MVLLEELSLLPVLRKLFETKNSRMILEGLGLLLKTWAGLPEAAQGEFEAKVNEVLNKAKKLVPADVGRTESVHTEIVMKAFELLVTEGLNLENEFVGGKLAGYLRVVMHRLSEEQQFDSFRRAA
ncbi:MAG: hypothetical protein HY073_02150 [Deltaproteobacteria bacterium]|nr:hypothetical protein [Deltaproteobacteria bacterium]